MGMKMVHSLGNVVWVFLANLEVDFLHKAEAPCLHVYPTEMKTCIYKNFAHDCFRNFFQNHQKLEAKQPSHYSIGECLHKQGYIHAMGLFPTTKRNELLK
jgi:hypothetical protein